jgi:hypothetical protein
MALLRIRQQYQLSGYYRKLSSPAEVMTAYPAVRWVVDTQEQRIQRPKNPRGPDGQPLDRQRPYFSGKKKQPTLKTCQQRV